MIWASKSEVHNKVKISVKLFATLRKHRFTGEEQDYPEGVTVRDVLVSLMIPEKEAAIILINGCHGKPDSPLKEGDLLAVFPPVGGG